MAIEQFKQWVIASATGIDGLQLVQDSIPRTGDDDVLVKFRSVSLNYRDLIVLNGDNSFPIPENIVPGSDGAGEVIQVGSRVAEFKPGDRVVTSFFKNHVTGHLSLESMQTALGALVDGPSQLTTEIGGAASMRQSLKAIRMGGIVSMVGNVGKLAAGELPITMADIFQSFATVRCIGVGNKQSFLEMNKVIVANNIKSVLDKTSFSFRDMKAAYQYMTQKHHIGKIIITIDQDGE